MFQVQCNLLKLDWIELIWKGIAGIINERRSGCMLKLIDFIRCCYNLLRICFQS